MEAVVTHRFYGAEDGKIYPRWFEVGEIVRGALASCAVEQGDAVTEKKRQPMAPEHLKTSSASPQDQVSQEPIAKPRRGRPPKSLS